MMNQGLAKFILTSLFLGGWATGTSAQVVNNIVPDVTLEAENSIVTPNGPAITRITGGATRGANLFHSFQDLSIGTNQTAWFDNPTTIQNILVRVTGGSRSDIDGTIRSNGTADLFLINPNGIRFGQNAKLNIGGAFSALTTAAIPLGNPGLFSATNPAQSQLLDIKPNAAFDLAQFQPKADIQMNASWNTNGQAITLVGQNIGMTGRLSSGPKANPATTLTLRSANNITLEKAQINNLSGNDLYVAEPNVAPVRLILQAELGNITIKDTNIGLYGGLFQATAPGKISLESSRLLSQSFLNRPAESILIQGGSVQLRGKSTIDASAITIATDNTIKQANSPIVPVTIKISSASPVLIENTRINQPREAVKDRRGRVIEKYEDEPELYPATFEPSRVPKRSNFYPTRIILDTNQDITIKSSKIALRSAPFEVNTAGDFLFENSQLYSDNYTNQNSAPITVQARNITLTGAEGMSGNAIYRGRAADIRLTASNNITLLTTAGLGSNTIGTGNAGNIELTAGNKVGINDGGIGNQSGSGRFNDSENAQITGRNGTVSFKGKTIVVKNYGVNVEHFGKGGGGQILLDAEDIEIGVGGFNSNGKGSSQGAEIVVKAAEKLEMQPKAGISTSAEKQSQGGNVRIEAKQFILKGSVTTSTRGEGKAGDILVQTPKIVLEQQVIDPQAKRLEISRGTISSYTGTTKENQKVLANGKAGDISIDTITSDGQVVIRSGSGIANTSFGDSQGNAGNITIRTGKLDIQNGSQLLIATNSVGNTGEINVDAKQSIRLSGTSISENGQSPSAILSTIRDKAKGITSQNIQIKSSFLEVIEGAGIISSTIGSGNSSSGNIKIDVKTAILNGSSTQGNPTQRLTSGILTSVGINQLPDGSIIKEQIITEQNERGVTISTLRPLIRSRTGNPNAIGNSGNISLNVDKLDVTQGAQLVTAILGAGQSGNVEIQSTGNIRLLDRGAIRADSGSGKGGSIDINSRGMLLLRRGGEISAVSRSNGQDGNINIETPFIVGITNENSDIFAVSQEALNGGSSVGNNIKIKADGILGFQFSNRFTPQNDILATGNLTLNLPDIDPSRGLSVLPTTPIEAAQKIDRTCNPNAANQSSSFVSHGPGGLPSNPTTSIVPSANLARLAQVPNRDLTSTKSPLTLSLNRTTTPIEAQTSVRLANGKIQFRSQTREVFSQETRSSCLQASHLTP